MSNIEGSGSKQSPLAHVLDYQSSTNEFLRQAALVYSATTNVITLPVAQGPQGAIAYMGSFLTALSSMMENPATLDTNTLGGVCYLLAQIFPHVKNEILVSATSKTTDLFINTLKHHAGVSYVARYLLSCFSYQLRALSTKSISSKEATQMIQALLVFSLDVRPKIRKLAQKAFIQVLLSLAYTHSNELLIPLPIETTFVRFCLLELDPEAKDPVPKLYLCNLLNSALPTLSRTGCAQIIARLLQCAAQGNQYILTSVFNVITQLTRKGFSTTKLSLMAFKQDIYPTTSIHDIENVSSSIVTLIRDMTPIQRQNIIDNDVKLLTSIIVSLIDLRPNNTNISASTSYDKCISSVYKLLHLLSPQTAWESLDKILSIYRENVIADQSPIRTSAFNTLQNILYTTLNKETLDKGINNDQKSHHLISKSINYIQELFMLPHTSLELPLKLVSFILHKQITPQHFNYFSDLLVMIDTYHNALSTKPIIQVVCESVLARALSCFGPVLVTSIIPLNLPVSPSQLSDNTSVIIQLKSSRLWLLSLMVQHSSYTTISYFSDYLLPHADIAYQLSIEAEKSHRIEEKRILVRIVELVWECLPVFLTTPTDLQSKYPELLKKLLQVYYQSDVLSSITQVPICKALRLVASKNIAIAEGRFGLGNDLGFKRLSLDDEEVIQPIKNDDSNTTIDGDDDDDDDKADNDDDDEEDETLHTSQTQTNPIKPYLKTTSLINKVLFSPQLTVLPPISVDEAKINVQVLAKQAMKVVPLMNNTIINILSSGTMPPDQLSIFLPIVLETILAYTCTMTTEGRHKIFDTVFSKLKETVIELDAIYKSVEKAQADKELAEEEDPESLDALESMDENGPTLEDAQPIISRIRALSDILVSMSPCISEDKVVALLAVIMSQFGSQSYILQNKSYHVCGQLITINDDIFNIAWPHVLTAIINAESTVHTTSLRSRLYLCRIISGHVQSPLKQQQLAEALPGIISEAILATKEASNRLHAVAFDLVVALGYNIYNSTDGTVQQKQQFLGDYLKIIIAGLTAQTPRMVSASATVLARLVYEFKNVINQNVIMEIFETILITLQFKSREILKAVLGFIKVAIVALDYNFLRPYVRQLLYTFSDWSNENKSRFKRKIRLIYTFLLRRYGLDFMRTATPPDDTRLIEYLRKQQQRQSNKDQRLRQDKVVTRDTSALFAANAFDNNKDNNTSEQDKDDAILSQYHAGMSFEDIMKLEDDDEDAADALSRTMNAKHKLQDDDLVQLGDDTDFMDPAVVGKIQKRVKGSSASVTAQPDDLSQSSVNKKRKMGIKSDTKMTEDGKLDFTTLDQTIKQEEHDNKMKNRVLSSQELLQIKKKRKEDLKRHNDEKEALHTQQNKERLGKEFTSSKAAGDMKKRGQNIDPYAYVPLDPRALNKRKSSIKSQSDAFQSVFENHPSKQNGAQLGQRLTRTQRAALKKKGGRFKKEDVIE